MQRELKYYHCKVCGNLVELVNEGGGELVCCGQNMAYLAPNTVDASKEKHVPALTVEGNTLTVQVGEVAHPMTAEHHIAFVTVVQGEKTQRVNLAVDAAPMAKFVIENGPVTVYAYCNLHGLWVANR